MADAGMLLPKGWRPPRRSVIDGAMGITNVEAVERRLAHGGDVKLERARQLLRAMDA